VCVCVCAIVLVCVCGCVFSLCAYVDYVCVNKIHTLYVLCARDGVRCVCVV